MERAFHLASVEGLTLSRTPWHAIPWIVTCRPAVQSRCEVIVTSNVKDFAPESTTPHQVSLVTPALDGSPLGRTIAEYEPRTRVYPVIVHTALDPLTGQGLPTWPDSKELPAHTPATSRRGRPFSLLVDPSCG